MLNRRTFIKGLAGSAILTSLPELQWAGCITDTRRAYGIIDKNGAMLLWPLAEFLSPFYDGLAIIGRNDKCGYVNSLGQIIIPCEYDIAVLWHGCDRLMVSSGNDSFFINRRNEAIRQMKDNIKYHICFCDDVASICIDDKWGFIDVNGDIVIDPVFDYDPLTGEFTYPYFSEGLAAIRENGKWGFIDKSGIFRIAPRFDAVRGFKDGLAYVRIEGKCGAINHDGEIIIKTDFDGISINRPLISISKNGKLGFMDYEGNIKIPVKYDAAGIFSDGLAWVRFEGGEGFIDESGELVLKCSTSSSRTWGSFAEGRCLIEVNEKCGFMDTSGSIVIEPKYDNCCCFSEGLAAVEIAGKWGFINTTGETVIDFRFKDSAWNYLFENGSCIVRV